MAGGELTLANHRALGSLVNRALGFFISLLVVWWKSLREFGF